MLIHLLLHCRVVLMEINIHAASSRAMVLLLLISSANGCPDFCSCLTSDAVDCSHRFLAKIEGHSIAKTTKLLYYSDNRLTNITYSHFKGLNYLRTLHLHNNKISNIEDASFDDLGNLTILSLNNNNLSSITKNTFHGPSRLIKLFLSNVHNGFPKLKIADGAFSNLRDLKDLILDDNKIDCFTDDTFAGLKRVIYLSFNFDMVSAISNKALLRFPASLEIVNSGQNDFKVCCCSTAEALSRFASVQTSCNTNVCTNEDEVCKFPTKPPLTSMVPTPSTSAELPPSTTINSDGILTSSVSLIQTDVYKGDSTTSILHPSSSIPNVSDSKMTTSVSSNSPSQSSSVSRSSSTVSTEITQLSSSSSAVVIPPGAISIAKSTTSSFNSRSLVKESQSIVIVDPSTINSDGILTSSVSLIQTDLYKGDSTTSILHPSSSIPTVSDSMMTTSVSSNSGSQSSSVSRSSSIESTEIIPSSPPSSAVIMPSSPSTLVDRKSQTSSPGAISITKSTTSSSNSRSLVKESQSIVIVDPSVTESSNLFSSTVHNESVKSSRFVSTSVDGTNASPSTSEPTSKTENPTATMISASVTLFSSKVFSSMKSESSSASKMSSHSLQTKTINPSLSSSQHPSQPSLIAIRNSDSVQLKLSFNMLIMIMLTIFITYTIL